MSSLSQSLFHFSLCAWHSGYRKLPKVMTLATFGGRYSKFEWLKCVPYMGRAVGSYANIFPTKCENIHNFFCGEHCNMLFFLNTNSKESVFEYAIRIVAVNSD